MLFDRGRYYLDFAAAFVRGRCSQGHPVDFSEEQRGSALTELPDDALLAICERGRAAGLELHKFKRTIGLARVRRVLGVLHAVVPTDLLDIGSGRGAALWPLLHEFPLLPVTAIDEDPIRSRDLQAVRLGGITRLTGGRMDATKIDFPPDAFDVVTLLEVLEHIPAVSQALAEALRVARRFVIISVPSQPDDNPQHVHLLDRCALQRLFAEWRVVRVTFDYVPGHLIAVANVTG